MQRLDPLSHAASMANRQYVVDPNFKITQTDLDDFCKSYTFDKLKEIPIGKAFCEKFHVDDFLLPMLQDELLVFEYIRKWYMNESKAH